MTGGEKVAIAKEWLAKATKASQYGNVHLSIKVDDVKAICELALNSTRTPEWLSQALNEGDGVYRP